MPRARKSTAKLWAQARTPGTRYRDRGTAHLPDGTSKPVSGYGPTKAAASADLDAKVARLENVPVQADTVTELFAEFVQHKRSVKGNKAKTIFDLEMWNRNVEPALGSLALSALTLEDVQRVQSGPRWLPDACTWSHVTTWITSNDRPERSARSIRYGVSSRCKHF